MASRLKKYDGTWGRREKLAGKLGEVAELVEALVILLTKK